MHIPFRLNNYKEFHSYARWHDYINISINEFAIFLIRKYTWARDKEDTTIICQLFGFEILRKLKYE
jgi:hypothetical protein